MAAETFRIEIPISVEDNTDPGVSHATRKMNAFDRVNQKTQEKLNQMNRTKYQVVLDALDRASGIIGRVSSKARSIAGKTFSFTMKVVDMATAPLRGIWNFATSIQGAILGATGAFAGIYKPMDIAGDYEQTQIAFETMLKSAEKAEQFLKNASEFANKTPFEFPELINSSKLLLAFGFEAEGVLDILKTVGDTASGLGAGSDGIDRITRALGQMQAKGRAQAEELLQLQELGVPANQILQEELGLTGERVANIGKESIEAAKVIDALLRGMDKRFGGMMGNQSKTAKGMMSTLKDTLQNSLLRPWGQGLWGGVKPGLEKITTWIDENQETIAAWGEAWKNAGANISKWVTSKVEGFQDSIRIMTNSQEWKDAQTFGAKMKIAWDQVIAQPFNEWWNSTGKDWLADKASKIGTGIGSAITFGILALLDVDVKGAAADGTSIGASFAEGFKVGFDGRKVGEGILNAIKGVFKDAGTLFPSGKEASSTSWISAGLLTLMGIKGSKAIGTIFKGGKGIYNYGKGLFKGSNAADAAVQATKAVGAATGSLDNATDIAKATAHLKDTAGSFRNAANASKEAEKAVKAAEVLKAAKQADLEKNARLLRELKKEAAKFGDDIPKGLSGKIMTANKAVTKGRIEVKKAASHLDDMVNMKSFKALEYANAREGFAIARDVANTAKATNQVGGAASNTGIFSKITGWLGKNSDNALIAGSQAAGKGIKGIPVLGTLLGLTASGAVVASAAPENRGRAAAGEAGSWLGAIGAGAGAGALVGTIGGGPIGTAAGAIAGGIGGAIGGEAFAEWLYDQKDAIGVFFSNTLPSVAGSAWDAIKMGASNAGSWIADKWSGFSDWFGTSVWKPVKDVGISAINIAAGIWSGARDVISDKWSDFSTWFDSTLWQPVSSAAQAAGQRVSDHWNDARVWISERWSDFYGWFEASIWGPVKTGAQAAGAWVSERWSAAKTWISETWGTVSGWFSETVWEPVKGAAQTAGTWLGNQFTAAKNAVSDAWSGVAGWFETNVWGPIKSGASAAWEWVGDKLGGIGEWIGDKWTSFKDWLGELGQKGSAETGLQTSQNKSSVLKHAWGGIMTKPHMGIVAEAGPEAIIPLTKPSRAQVLWQQVGNIMGFTETQNKAIGENLQQVTSVSEVAKRFANVKDIAESTKRLADVVDITRYRNLKQAVNAYAKGGILTKPHMGIVAEDGAEGIIPLSPSKRSRGIDLWQRTGEILGVQPYEDGGQERDASMAVSTGTASRSSEGVNFTVNNKIEPSFTFEIRAGADPDEIVAVIKSRTQEFTDEIGDNLAERLARIFANMPMKGALEA